MSTRPLFEGLVYDENDQPVTVSYVGAEACYVVDDDGFHRHISSEKVDRQVLEAMTDSVKGHEDILTDQAAKMLGQDDPFSRAMIEQQFKNMDKQIDQMFETGIPDEVKSYLGLTGLKIRINHSGEVLEVNQPGHIAPEDE